MSKTSCLVCFPLLERLGARRALSSCRGRGWGGTPREDLAATASATLERSAGTAAHGKRAARERRRRRAPRSRAAGAPATRRRRAAGGACACRARSNGRRRPLVVVVVVRTPTPNYLRLASPDRGKYTYTVCTYLFAVSGSSLYIYRLYLLTYLLALTPHRHADAACNRAVMSTLALALCGRATRPFGTGQRALLATLSTNLGPRHWERGRAPTGQPMQAAQSVLLIVADDMQPSDIHALRHLHAPPILAETPWQALEHVPIWNFEPVDCVNLLLIQVR